MEILSVLFMGLTFYTFVKGTVGGLYAYIFLVLRAMCGVSSISEH